MATAQRINDSAKTFLNGTAALPANTRVALVLGVLAIGGLTANDIGVTEYRIEANQHGTVRLRNTQGTVIATASKAIAVGDTIYTAAGGAVSNVGATGSFLYGRALTAAAAAGEALEIMPLFVNVAHA